VGFLFIVGNRSETPLLEDLVTVRKIIQPGCETNKKTLCSESLEAEGKAVARNASPY
jgi:hypothetical protein